MSSNYPGPYDQYANTSWDKAQQPRGLDTPVQEILKFQQRQLQHTPGRSAYLPQNQQVNYNAPGMTAAAPDATQLLQQAKIILAQANPQLANSANSTTANNQAFRLLQQLTQQPQPQQQGAYPASSVGVANRAVFGQQPAQLHQYDQRLATDYLAGRQASTQASLYGQSPSQTQARALPYGSGYEDPRNLSAQLSNYSSLSAQSNQGSLFSQSPSQSTSRQGSSSSSSGFSSSNNNSSSSRNSSSSSSRSSGGGTSNRDRPRSNNNSSNNNSGFRRNDDNGSSNSNRRNDRRDDRRDDRSYDPPPRREPERAKSPKKETRKRKASPPPSTSSAKSNKAPLRSSEPIQKTEFHHSFAVKQIDYLQLKQRHRKLHIPKDFSHVECLCADLNNDVPTNFYIDIDCNTKKDDSSKIDQILKVDSETASIASNGAVYTSKVMLFAGFKQPHGKSNSHLSNQLKFIVGKKDRSELFCIGGAWSNERDGGDPSVDRSVLKATAIHYFKEFTGIDLSVCKDWIHFMDIHYQRPTGSEISVIWIPCIWQSPLLNNIVSNLASSKDLSASTSSSPIQSTASAPASALAAPTSSNSPAQASALAPAESAESALPATIDGQSSSVSTSSTDVEQPLSTSSAENTSIENPESISHEETTDQTMEDAPEPGQLPSSPSNTGNSSDTTTSNSDIATTTTSNSDDTSTTTSTTTTTNINTEAAADLSDSDISNNNNAQSGSDTTPTNNSTNNQKDSSLSSSSSLRESSSSLKEASISSRTRINLVTNVSANVKLKPMSLSLHGLLEYDETDVFEKTFEVSLFGELFNDMLKREFGATILHALDLYSKRRSNALTSSNEPPPSKKQKLDEADTLSNTSNELISEEKPMLSTTEDTALLRAMDFFDKHGHGYLRPDEMETILYCLGKSLCKRVVEELVDKVIDPDSGRILYKKMIEDRCLFGHEL